MGALFVMIASPAAVVASGFISAQLQAPATAFGQVSFPAVHCNCIVISVMQAAEVRTGEVCGFDMNGVNRCRWHPTHTAGWSTTFCAYWLHVNAHLICMTSLYA